MINKERFEQLKNKNTYSAYYINANNICEHVIVYIISDTLEQAKNLVQQVEIDEYELLEKTIRYMCKFKDLTEEEQELFEDKLIYFFEPECCN